MKTLRDDAHKAARPKIQVIISDNSDHKRKVFFAKLANLMISANSSQLGHRQN